MGDRIGAVALCQQWGGAIHRDLVNVRCKLVVAVQDLIERDLVTFYLRPGAPVMVDNQHRAGVSAQWFYREFGVTDDEFNAILVGKDGTVKLNRKTAVSAQALFDLIDSMPMRQWEMQNPDA